MTIINNEFADHIARSGTAARAIGQYVEIDNRFPTLLVHRGRDDEYFFQEQEAGEMLDEVPDNVSAQDYFLWVSKGW